MKLSQWLTLIITTASNVAGIIPLVSLFWRERFFGVFIVIMAITASIMMHATETKHRLPGLCFPALSSACLNMDRFFACLAALYGGYLFLTHPSKHIYQVIVPLVAACFAIVGEATENLLLYTLCHSTWHAGAYIGLSLVVH